MNPVNEMLRWKELASCNRNCRPKEEEKEAPVPAFQETEILIPLPTPPPPKPLPPAAPRPPDDLQKYNAFLGIPPIPAPSLVEGFTSVSYTDLEANYQKMLDDLAAIQKKNQELEAKILEEQVAQENILKKDEVQKSFERLYEITNQRSDSYQKMFLTMFSVALLLVVVTVVFYQLFTPR